MTDKELLQLFEKPEDEKAYLEFMFGDGKRHIMEKVIQTPQFKEFFPKMIEQDDEYWCYHGDEIEVAIGSRLSWLSYLSEQKEPYSIEYTVGETNFPMHAYSFTFDNKKYWLITIIGQGATNWIMSEDKFFETYIIKLPNNHTIGNLTIEPETAIGTLSSKNHDDTLVLNWEDSSCVLIMDNFNILDLRKIPFDKLTCIELNGFRFVKEVK